MRNVSDEICRENQNIHFTFNNFFPIIVPFMRKCGKNLAEPERPSKAQISSSAPCSRKSSVYIPPSI
jgi:hypothetical protein